jgi:hypothetical protein
VTTSPWILVNATRSIPKSTLLFMLYITAITTKTRNLALTRSSPCFQTEKTMTAHQTQRLMHTSLIPIYPIPRHISLPLQLPQAILHPLHHLIPIRLRPPRRHLPRQIRPQPRHVTDILARVPHLRDVCIGLAATEDDCSGWQSVVLAPDVGFFRVGAVARGRSLAL